MSLAHYVGTLNLLGDESRIRLCALLRERELSVTDLVRVTGISQSRVSTHLARLREGGFVRDRREGQHSFYASRAQYVARDGQGGARRGDELRGPHARGRPAPPPGARRRAARRAPGVVRRRDGSPLLAGAHVAVARHRDRRAPPARRRSRRGLRRRRGRRLPGALLPFAHLHRHEPADDRGGPASGSPRIPTSARR